MKSVVQGSIPVWILLMALAAAAQAATTAPLTATEPGRLLEAPSLTPPAGPIAPNPIAPPVLAGWPQVMPVHPAFAPVGVVLADLDGDGDLEVLAGSTNNLFYVWEHDGTARPGWPVNLGGQIQSKAAAADLDGDGDLEIVVAVKSGQIHVLHDDGSALAGWPQASGLTFGLLSPSVYDLDGDETPEVLIGGGGSLRVWSADGLTRPGFPVAVPGTISGTLAIGDLVGDDAPEIFVVSTSRELHGFDRDGAPLAGWPVFFDLSTSYAAPTIGDLDGDGTNEVCVVGYEFGLYDEIHAYHGDGSEVAGFPVSSPSSQTYSCPVLGDADGDGDLEIFITGKITGDAFYGWDHLGALLPGWPVAGAANMEGSAIVVDFDGLPGLEIAVGDNSGPGLIFGHNLDGSVASDFPIPKPGISGPNAPEVGDVDGDGDLDMAMTTWDGSVTIWDFPVAYDEDAVEWGTLFHDDWNTNQHGFVVPGGDLTAAQDPPSASGFALGAAFPNPADDRPTTIPLALSRAARLRLSVHDVAGRTVRTLHEGELTGGEHRFRWDGRDADGRPSAAGVYFIRLEAPGIERQTRKLTLLR